MRPREHMECSLRPRKAVISRYRRGGFYIRPWGLVTTLDSPGAHCAPLHPLTRIKRSPLFYKTALSPALYYGIMAISCRKTSGAVGKNRFVWQPAMRKEFMYEEQ